MAYISSKFVDPKLNWPDVVIHLASGSPASDYALVLKDAIGMTDQVSAASWALERGIAVVICNGTNEQAVSRIVQGKRIGTFFTDHKSLTNTVETHAVNAKKGSRRV
ncbi:hypothetical protein JTE90_007385 [Oedothorax gibbosus]|uniref:Uncharacterized protein n=1 Tax=Oedothorax gibbosus TaxID=931172 RepID=A0AAV6TRZ2_9ARAC|nr:hypothetical protein JTE90_007385 [Oedothorax gibbosus]